MSQNIICRYKYSLNPELFVSTIIRVEISFDTAKDAANLEKHGISLAAAATLEWANALVWLDERHNYGEVRMCAISYILDRLYYVAYVNRDEACRIISLRKANLREVKRYAET